MTPTEIVALQKRLRLTQAQFAAVLGISRSRLNDYTGKRAPRRPTDAVIPTLETELLRCLARYAEVTAP